MLTLSAYFNETTTSTSSTPDQYDDSKATRAHIALGIVAGLVLLMAIVLSVCVFGVLRYIVVGKLEISTSFALDILFAYYIINCAQLQFESQLAAA